MPSAQTSTVNPGGTLSLSIGNSLAGRPVMCGANGCNGEAACSDVRPCCHAGGAAGGGPDGACCASAAIGAIGAIATPYASVDSITRRIDMHDMESLLLPHVCYSRWASPSIEAAPPAS